MRQELGLIGGHIHSDGTIAFATFTGKAEVDRVLDVFVAPTTADDVALGHFPEQVGASTGRVLLFAGHSEAWTHYAALVVTAFSHSHAAERGLRQAAVIFRKLKMSFWYPR